MQTTIETTEVDLAADFIDVRDIIARVEQLESELKPAYYRCGGCDSLHPLFFTNDCRDDANRFASDELDAKHGELGWDEVDEESEDLDREELSKLTELLDDLRGNGGDEEWCNSWYPVSLIRESHFEDYARELAEDIGAIDRNANWPLAYIDWEAAAEALLVDYTSTEIEGVTYYYR